MPNLPVNDLDQELVSLTEVVLMITEPAQEINLARHVGHLEYAASLPGPPWQITAGTPIQTDKNMLTSASAPPLHQISIQSNRMGMDVIIAPPCIQDLSLLPNEDLAPCVMEGIWRTRTVHFTSALGWFKQSMSVLSQHLVQEFYSMFREHNTPETERPSMGGGSQHHPGTIRKRSVTSGNERVITMQPTTYKKEQQVGYAGESDLEAGVYRHNTHSPILHPTKYNIMADSESHQVGGDDPVSCTFKDVLRDHLVHLLPVSAYKHKPHHVPLCIQCGPQEEPGCQNLTHPEPAPKAAQESSLKLNNRVKNDIQQLVDNMEGDINNDSEWVIMAQPTTNDDQHTTLPLPSQSSTTSDSESPIENREEMFSCTLRNVLKDHFLHLLPVYAGNAPPQHNPLSIQCGYGVDHAQQSHIHSVNGPSKSVKESGRSMGVLHGKVAPKGQLTGLTGEGDLAGEIQSPSVLGWVTQRMGTLSHSLVQRVYSKFTTHEPHSNIQTSQGGWITA